MTTFDDLPTPPDADLERSRALTQYIKKCIDSAAGRISFATFMEHALYHPTLGYYQSKNMDLGSKGDFTTAPEISPLFGQCIARQCEAVFATLKKPSLLEIGAGTGRLARDLLEALAASNHLPQQYYIYDISLSLRKKQRDFLQQALPAHLFERIIWLDALPTDFTGVIIANEVLDAMPVHCFQAEDKMMERCVTWNGEQFVWQLDEPLTASCQEALEILQARHHFAHGYASEMNLGVQTFLGDLSRALKQGLILLADYGYGENEYYHPQRSQGTLTCFYRHHHHADPFHLVGLQDLTAHVDFTRVAEYAFEQNLDVLGFTSQSSFLLSCGLIALAEQQSTGLTEIEQFKVNQSIKTLTLPTEMGDRIKFMALGKEIDPILLGFQLQDRRRDL